MTQDTTVPDTIYYMSSHPHYKEEGSFNGGVEMGEDGKVYRTEVVYREYAPRTLYSCVRLTDPVDTEHQSGSK